MTRPPSLYERVLGTTAYAALPCEVQRFHRLQGHHVLHGVVETQAPASPVAAMLARVLGTPRQATHGPLRFELSSAPQAERWTRHFPGLTMQSTLLLAGGQLEERLGAARLRFTLRADAHALNMVLEGLRCFGLPCPRWLQPDVVAEETGGDGRLHFRVSARLPLVGVVASYRGHLNLPAEASP